MRGRHQVVPGGGGGYRRVPRGRAGGHETSPRCLCNSLLGQQELGKSPFEVCLQQVRLRRGVKRDGENESHSWIHRL